MPLFRYRAVDSGGAPIEGTMDEPSASRVSAILDERGYQVSSIEQVAKRNSLLSLKPRLDWGDIQVLNDQLLAVSKSRLPMVPALETLAMDVRRPRLKRVLTSLREDLERGSTLDDAIDRCADRVPFIYRSLIRAGERSGNLPGVLAIAGIHSRRMNEMRNNLQTALAYPALVSVAAFALLFGFLYYLIPGFAETYADFGSGLPAPTQFWFDVSALVRRHVVAVLMAIGLLVFGTPLFIRLLRRWEFGSVAIDWTKERMPVLGKTFGQISTARFARSLGTLLSSGVHAVEALDLAAAASGNAWLRRSVREATEHIAAGEQIADALSDTGYFSHTFCWLLSTGEQRGEIETSLLSIAETLEREVGRRDRIVGFLAMPLLILLIGLVIVAALTSIYLPIFSLGDAISS